LNQISRPMMIANGARMGLRPAPASSSVLKTCRTVVPSRSEDGALEERPAGQLEAGGQPEHDQRGDPAQDQRDRNLDGRGQRTRHGVVEPQEVGDPAGGGAKNQGSPGS
jgi:hypothetical protein